ncbi:SHOCT domain-containing protein [Lactobacillus delbrueckii]|uniref:SHOCT domain-containing protein n=1 Tax=Lactobacillus delbrueckii subsp. lactis TaxID=29397 RepID=A0A3G6JDC7_LACDL|nr:MAG: SHOCT domain-containing protein [Lactobacillus delbrueckii subsp. lactis]
MIKRRLVGGILLLVLALFELLLFITYCVEYLDYSQLTDAVFMSKYLVFMIWSIVLGIIYIATCKRRPVKWQEVTLACITPALTLFTYSSLIAYLPAYNLFRLVLFFLIVFQCLGLPGKNGFKDYPYKDQGHDSQSQGHDSQSIDKLAKLKELLDSGAITQEEFDQEKEKIWK